MNFKFCLYCGHLIEESQFFDTFVDINDKVQYFHKYCFKEYKKDKLTKLLTKENFYENSL